METRNQATKRQYHSIFLIVPWKIWSISERKKMVISRVRALHAPNASTGQYERSAANPPYIACHQMTICEEFRDSATYGNHFQLVSVIMITLWRLVQILDVINLAPVPAVLAKRLLIVVLLVKQPIGLTTRRSAKDTCARWVRLMLSKRPDFILNRTGCKHFVIVSSQQRS